MDNSIDSFVKSRFDLDFDFTPENSSKVDSLLDWVALYRDRLKSSRLSKTYQVSKLLPNFPSIQDATVSTDKDDYSPRETATIFGSNFDIGETIQLQVLHTDGTLNDGEGHTPWFVTDGGRGDLDGIADGNFRTAWYVDPDDSLNSTFELTAVGQTSQEVATHTFTDSDPAVQFFYVPFEEKDIIAAFDTINGADSGDNLDNVISITTSTNNTIVYYDHWEDGYETDLDNPTQSSTEVWGDNDPSNGIAPGFTVDLLNSGDIIALEEVITTESPNNTRNPNSIFFDGRDKVGASKAVVLTRQVWSTQITSFLAGAAEVLDTSKWGTSFTIPVGEDISSDSMFEYTALSITAAENGTTINIDTDGDGNDDLTNISLDEGETYFVDGGIDSGATVTSVNKPIQAHLVTGDINSSYESRWYTLFPTDQLSDTYYTPVGEVTTNRLVDIFLYNHSGSQIDITSSEATEDPTDSSTSSTFSIPSGAVARRRLLDDSAVRFSEDNGSSFSAIAAIDAGGQIVDWGFSLIPDANLTPIVQIGWGLGADDQNNDGVPDKNSSPLWVTTSAATTIYVDYDGDGVGSFTDINGGQYDESFTLGELESRQIYDTLNNDNDQTGIKVYTLDGTDIIATWGQSSLVGVSGDESLDLGTTVLPLPISSAWKISTIIGDDGDGLGDEGETIEYKINIQNDGVILLGNVNVSDIIPAGTSYVPNSTSIAYINGKINQEANPVYNSIADDIIGTAFPLDDDDTDNGFDAGLNIGTIDVGNSTIVKFRVTINDPYDGSSSGFIANAANVDSDDETFTVAVQTELDPTIVPTTQTKTLYLSDGNDLDRIDPVNASDTSDSASNSFVRDEFGTVAYNNNDGVANWSSNWIEVGESDGASNGNVSITGGELTLDDNPDSSGTPGLERGIDLSGATNAILTFDFATSSGVDADDAITLDISNNGGSSYDTTLETFTGFTGANNGSRIYSLDSADLTANTQIRFRVTNFYGGSNETFSIDDVQITYDGDNLASASFSQSIPMQSDFEIVSGNNVVVSAYVNASDGVPSDSSDIVASLTDNSGTIATFSSPDSVTSQGNDIYLVTWQGTLNSNATVAEGEAISLDITNNESNLTITVLHDSNTYPSKIDLPTTTVIDVDSIQFYNDSSANGGNQINASTDESTVYVRVQVSDPFGDYDITGLNLVIDEPDTTEIVNVNLTDSNLVDTSVDDSGNGIKIYEYAWSIANGADLGDYTITATATEGLESSPLTDQDSTTFTVNNSTDPDVFIGNATVTEGTPLVFDVTLTDTSATDITLDLKTTEVTATAVGDYETTNFEYSTDGGNTWISGGGTNSTQVTIPAGQTGIKVRIDSVSDTTDEPDETFILGVDSVVSGGINNFADTGTGTILDDDDPPNISIDDVSLTEGNSDTKDFTFTITLDQASSQTVTVGYYTSDDTATAPSDYEAIASMGSPEILTFAPGETSKTVTVSVNGDTEVESDEIFNLNLDAATNAQIIDTIGIGTIINDDSVPDVVIGDDSEVEGNQLVFDVGLTSASSEEITLTLAATGATDNPSGGTATGVTDFENTNFEYSTDNGQTWNNATSDQVIIPAGETSIKVRIDSITDATSEGNETFTLGVTAASGSVNGASAVNDFSDTGTGTIIDDDGTPAISIDDVSLFEGDSGTTSFTFTVSLDTASSSNLTVDYYTSDGTATTADSDYTALGSLVSPLTLTFAPGETSKTITVDVTGDTPVESDETFTVNLLNPQNLDVPASPPTISDNSGLGTILNDDDNTGTISGTVLADIDNDNDGDQALSGVTIELLDENGNSIDSDAGTTGIQPTTTTTAVDGTYSFTNVDPGNYLIKQTNLAGYFNVSDEDSVDDGTDDTETGSDGSNDNLITVVLSNQESDTANDFIDEATGTIIGEVLADTNNDDVGDSPLSGVTVELFEDGGVTAIATTTTDSNGNYSFTDVAPGDYEVRETNPSDYGDVTDSDGDANSNGFNTIDLTLATGGISTGNDFIDERGVISGRVQADTDNDDTGDVDLENVTITLKDNLGATVATITTDSNGNYSFTDLPSGTYTVEQINLAGYIDVSEDEGGSDDDTGSNGTLNNIIDVIITAGEEDTGNDFVDEAQPETIAGKVLEDTNGDGIGDSPLAGVEITLSGAASNTTTTASDGSYSFDVNATGAGTYTLTSPASGTGTVAGYDHLNELDSTTDSGNDTDLETNSIDNNRSLTVALVTTEIDTGNDFVYEAQTGTISGTVFADDGGGNNGKDNVVLNLLDGAGSPVLDNIGNPITATTSGGGIYSFPNLEPGDYQIQEVDPSGYSSVSDGDSTTDAVEDDTTNSNTNDNIIAVTLLGGETDTGNDFYDQLNGTISGTVTEDTTGDNSGNNNLGGITVTLKDSNGNTVATNTTDSNGIYSFSDITPGDYTVEQTDLTGYSSVNDGDSTTDATPDDAPNSSTTDNTLAVTLLAGETDDGNDFVDAQNVTISGTVLADTTGDGNGDTALSGVTITLDDGDGGTTNPTTTTASDGTYSFTDVAPGTYTIVETDPTSYVSVEDEDTVDDGTDDTETGSDGSNDNNITVALIPGETDTGNDFIDEQTGTISGTVTDNGSNPLSGVTISLFNTDTSTTVATTTTAGNGIYSFTDVTPGNYEVRETDPSNYNSVSDTDSVNDGSDDTETGSDGSNDNTITVALADGESDTGNDFVDQVNATGLISGTVLEDTNGDGIGDTPLSGVTINLSGQENRSTTTAADGTYSFTSLSNGSYTVTETNPTGYGDVDESDGTNDNSISVNISNNASTGNDFVDGLFASISGVVWDDLDTNNFRGTHEDGVAGLSITLTGGGTDGVIGTGGDDTTANVNTAADGSYSFTDLDPGQEYQITFPTSATGYSSLTTQDQGADEAIDSDANTSTGIATNNNTTSPITLTPGEARTGIDAGLVPNNPITINGNDYSETLSGTTGDDVIAGYKGQDTLTGGNGSDTFFFNETSDGVDFITDFTSGADRLDFSRIVEEIENFVGSSIDPIVENYITWENFSGVGTMVRVDFDAGGSLNPKDVVFLQNPNDTIVDTDFIL